jgi:hypothetical protein
MGGGKRGEEEEGRKEEGEVYEKKYLLSLTVKKSVLSLLSFNKLVVIMSRWIIYTVGKRKKVENYLLN